MDDSTKTIEDLTAVRMLLLAIADYANKFEECSPERASAHSEAAMLMSEARVYIFRAEYPKTVS